VKKYLIMMVAAILAVAGLGAGMIGSASADTGAQGVGIVKVDSPADVPADAVPYSLVKRGCKTIKTWRLTVPGSDESSHQEFRYMRTIENYTTKWHIEKTYAEDVFNDAWYSYNPGVDKGDDDPTTGAIDKDNGWQIDQGNHKGLYSDPNFAVGTPWQSAGGNGAWWYVDRSVTHHTGDIYPGHGGDIISNTQPTEFNGHQIGVPFEIAGMMFVYVITGSDQIDNGSHNEFFVLGEEPSLNDADASWILPEQLPADQGWEQFDERTVVDTEETQPVITDYVYNDHKECNTPIHPPKHHTPDHPGVPTLIDAGL
jgi:hypothetical protein